MMRLKLLAVVVSVAFSAGCAQMAQSPGGDAKPAAPAAEAKKFTQYKHIVDYAYVKPHASLPRERGAGALVIDSRPTARRYDDGHIPAAINIPDSSFDKMTNLLPADKNRELIFYCQGLDCELSHNSAFKAEKLGYKNIKVYAAGIPDWEAKGEISSISTAFMKKLVDSKADVVLIDSRPERPFAAGTIPGAINISDSKFAQMVDKLPKDKAKPLIFFCGGLACDLSEKSAKKAKALGYTNVRKYTEGYPDWAAKFGTAPAVATPAAAPAAAAAAPAKAAGLDIQPGKEKGSISVASFERILKENPAQILIVDVRAPAEFKLGSFPGAINLPVAEVEDKFATIPRNKPVVFTCATGARSGEAYDTTNFLDNKFNAYFLDANVKFADGKYTITGR
ncbi:MAG: rhodanese-like domain-containing protein [Rhodocyclaceae bacterium]|nr:rhodanese-like domain-containing protein [Rhodocyclaceae bacterium]